MICHNNVRWVRFISDGNAVSLWIVAVSVIICSYYIFILFLIVKYVHYLLSVKFHCSCIPNPCYVTFRYVRYLLSARFIVDNVIEYVFLVSDCCNVSIINGLLWHGSIYLDLIPIFSNETSIVSKVSVWTGICSCIPGAWYAFTNCYIVMITAASKVSLGTVRLPIVLLVHIVPLLDMSTFTVNALVIVESHIGRLSQRSDCVILIVLWDNPLPVNYY